MTRARSISPDGTPPPPSEIGGDPIALAIWKCCYAAAVVHGFWQPQYVIGLRLLAKHVSLYIRLVQSRIGGSDDLTEMRRGLREQLEIWSLLPPGRAEIAAQRGDGIDADIARLAGL